MKPRPRRLNEKLGSLRDQTSEAEAYQATLEEQITTYQTSIDLAVQNITQLNTNITNLEAEIKKADEEYADTFAELKVRLQLAVCFRRQPDDAADLI